MSSVLRNEKTTIDEGKLLNEAINKGLMSFSPDLMMSHLAKNYYLAEQLYGETILKLISGYDPNYLKKNINIPEFQRELTKIIKKNIEKLKDENLLDHEGQITEEGYDRAAYTLYIEEVEKLIPSGLQGEKVHKYKAHYGDSREIRPLRKGDRYKDLAVKETVKMAVRRGHKKLHAEDLRAHERQQKGEVHIIYGLDASGSMKGKKLEAAKKAGVALAFQAIKKRDYAGLIVFGSDIIDAIEPTQNLKQIVQAIAKVRAGKETEFGPLLTKAQELFSKTRGTKHLIILTDAMPTVGDDPKKSTMLSVAMAKDQKITISLVGIGLDKRGEELAREMVELGEGRLYTVKNLEMLDKIILEDYSYVK